MSKKKLFFLSFMCAYIGQEFKNIKNKDDKKGWR